ncbi:sensor histidine kinase [Chromobacterium violaceum]|uniref:histidine kinase n=1 Tax=Chromobacterium violaceum TaxID=536 RepID=A0AAX2M8B5_CHRVL|nr:HAMP domain-containing sensor histidine kinase [Chromobacterium violaceum]OLZ83456.1 hypothetical protein BS642_05420 [Chromobacterium violaceum]STB63998.1 Sensor protein qseC [Chromobacterium violaceum]SUX32233.1 Sensor protein qseC [Chromobacterium violaceum]
MSVRLRLFLILGAVLGLLLACGAVWFLSELGSVADEWSEASEQWAIGWLARMPSTPTSWPWKAAAAGEESVCRRTAAQTDMLPAAPGLPPRPRVAVPGVAIRNLSDEALRDDVDRRALRARQLSRARRRVAVCFLIVWAGSLAIVWLGVGLGGRQLGRLRGLLSREAASLPGLPREPQAQLASLNRLLIRTGQALQRERRLACDAAHELRTPLTVIKTHLQVAQIVGDAEARRALGHALEGTSRLQRVLEQMLTLAHLDEGDASAEEARARADDVVGRAVEDATWGLCWRVSCSVQPALAVALPLELAVIALRNLLDNALRYSPSDAAVMLTVSASAGMVSFEVSDLGDGLSEEECRLATRRFWRGRHRGDGCGLGLPIVSSIAERFGGRLVLRRGASRGLVVVLVLPAASPAC